MKVAFKNLILIPLIALLTACGSGGGSLSRDDNNGGGGSTDVTYSISLSIVDKNTGESSRELSASSPLLANAKVTRSDGSSTEGKTVTFTFDEDGKASFAAPNGNGRAVVGSDGIATIEVKVGENNGAVNITASLDTYSSNSEGIVSAGDGSQSSLEPASLNLYSSNTLLPSTGSDQVEVIALVKDDANILLEGVDVSFSADSGALTPPTPTGADGTSRVILTTGGNPQNRDITVIASAGALSQQIVIKVVGTEVKINGPSSVILQDTAEYTFILADSDGNGIAGEALTFSSSNNNLFSAQSAITDETGQVTIEYQAVNSGLDTITASALGDSISGSIPVTVQQDNFSFITAPAGDVALNSPTNVTVKWLTDNIPVVGQPVSFNTTRGTVTPSSGVTNANGELTVSLESASSGPVKVSAKGTHSNGDQVNSQISFEYIATTVSSIKVDATPDSIGPEQKSTITAVIRDSLGNLVKGKEIKFNTTTDATGGSLSAGSAVTDSNGLASVVYSSKNVSGEDGITISATLAEDTNITGSVSLTVGDRAFDISLGTGREIQVVNEATYLKTFVAFVTDANSNPVENAELTVSGTPVKYTQLTNPNDPSDPMKAYYKGYWVKSPSEDDFRNWASVYTIGCTNEDIDADGNLDAGEDTNGDGELTPGNVVAVTDNVMTDENGQAIIEIRYPKNYGPWVVIKLTVSGGQSAGTESKVSQFYTLGVAASDLTDEVSPPPSNPFGTGLDLVDDPMNPGSQIDTGNNRTCSNRQ
ncbi:Ig-like domain-containing protein [Neptunicella sp. SCSIO 80796]|uniref:Ig-like domain-containing protein n=1 Tax=Neptunicella plasticusilytica TaxID=3117012 RepID=UPI003A4DD8B7